MNNSYIIFRECSLNMGGGGGRLFFRKLRRGGRLVFCEVGRGGKLFFRKKISKLNALSIKLITLLTENYLFNLMFKSLKSSQIAKFLPMMELQPIHEQDVYTVN